MASNADSSFLDPLSAQVSSQSESEQSPSLSSNIWRFTRPAQGDEDPKKQYCLRCEENTPKATPYGSDVASNMRKHYLKIHKTVIKPEISRIQVTTLQQLQQLYLQVHATGQTSTIDDQVFQNYLNKEVINEALVSLVVVQNLAFKLVEAPEFHIVCQAFNPKAGIVILNAYTMIGYKVIKAFQDHKDVVRKKLQSALTHIHLSLDI